MLFLSCQRLTCVETIRRHEVDSGELVLPDLANGALVSIYHFLIVCTVQYVHVCTYLCFQ